MPSETIEIQPLLTALPEESPSYINANGNGHLGLSANVQVSDFVSKYAAGVNRFLDSSNKLAQENSHVSVRVLDSGRRAAARILDLYPGTKGIKTLSN